MVLSSSASPYQNAQPRQQNLQGRQENDSTAGVRHNPKTGGDHEQVNAEPEPYQPTGVLGIQPLLGYAIVKVHIAITEEKCRIRIECWVIRS